MDRHLTGTRALAPRKPQHGVHHDLAPRVMRHVTRSLELDELRPPNGIVEGIGVDLRRNGVIRIAGDDDDGNRNSAITRALPRKMRLEVRRVLAVRAEMRRPEEKRKPDPLCIGFGRRIGIEVSRNSLFREQLAARHRQGTEKNEACKRHSRHRMIPGDTARPGIERAR